MKKLKFVMFSAVLLGLTAVSCGDDDSSSTGAKLEGKWIYAKEGIAAQGQEMLEDHVHTAGCDKDYMEITSTSVKDVTFYKDGDVCKEDATTDTYKREGNTITVTEDGEDFKATIEKLTGSELRISTSESEGGVTIKYISTYTRG